jgi:hypothetical protein
LVLGHWRFTTLAVIIDKRLKKSIYYEDDNLKEPFRTGDKLA